MKIKIVNRVVGYNAQFTIFVQLGFLLTQE
jgi:hypothetical protein